MLNITRKEGQSFQIGDALVIIQKTTSGRVTLAIAAPPEIKILRTELVPEHERINHNDQRGRDDQVSTPRRTGQPGAARDDNHQASVAGPSPRQIA